MPRAAADLLTDAALPPLKPTKKIVSSDVDWESYKELAQHEIDGMKDTVAAVESSPTLSGLNNCINKLSCFNQRWEKIYI